MIEPAEMSSPQAFTPSIFGLESRPFRVEPPFLCHFSSPESSRNKLLEIYHHRRGVCERFELSHLAVTQQCLAPPKLGCWKRPPDALSMAVMSSALAAAIAQSGNAAFITSAIRPRSMISNCLYHLCWPLPTLVWMTSSCSFGYAALPSAIAANNSV
jgi:hypothetical protein